MENSKNKSNINLQRKRKILIVEDNEINRDILASILENEYDLLFAENGKAGIKILEKYYRSLSLVILDVYMPVCDGFQFLEIVKKDSLLSNVPIIVTTASDKPEDEAKCLKLNASDFITKPYNPEVVLGRIKSIIKLKESVAALSIVEYDELTGLLTLPAFYHHAQNAINEMDSFEFDISVADMKNFKLVNSIYGEKRGDQILIDIAKFMKMIMPNSYIARQGDKFFIFYESSYRFNNTESTEAMSLYTGDNAVSNIIIKYGLYMNIDKSLPISILCDRAVMAVNSIKDDPTINFAVYDKKMEEHLLKNQKMEMNFDRALQNNEFVVWYQPKIDTKSKMIIGAEALARWIPEDGKMISPGEFIPLFEKDGKIARLDEYIFRKVCSYQRKRIDESKDVIPISVNLSRNSIYQNDPAALYNSIIDEFGIPISLVPIELTESAAAEGNDITNVIESFVNYGFTLHMDDFGTGYSSLSTLAFLPFDVIKLDKSLIDHIGSTRGNTVIRYMVNIAQEIGMKLIAEGVETEKQAEYLRQVGCDQMQGFYFYKPVDEKTLDGILEECKKTESLDLDREYQRINIHYTNPFDLDDRTYSSLERIAEGMMEGFFIYRATCDETLLYANNATIRIFGCDNLADFRRHINNSFRGIVHPDDYEEVEKSIFEQVNRNIADNDAVNYRIICKDGTIKKIIDKGYCVNTESYGNVFYVFIMEDKN